MYQTHLIKKLQLHTDRVFALTSQRLPCPLLYPLPQLHRVFALRGVVLLGVVLLAHLLSLVRVLWVLAALPHHQLRNNQCSQGRGTEEGGAATHR